MDNRCLIEGLREIGKFFGDDYKPEAVKVIQPDVLEYPNEAMMAVYKRAITEFPQKYLPPIGKIKDLIIIEGRKIQAKEIDEREQEAEERRRQERKKEYGLPKGQSDYDKARSRLLLSIIQPDHKPEDVLLQIVKLAKDHPEIERDERGDGYAWRETYDFVFRNYLKTGWMPEGMAA